MIFIWSNRAAKWMVWIKKKKKNKCLGDIAGHGKRASSKRGNPNICHSYIILKKRVAVWQSAMDPYSRRYSLNPCMIHFPFPSSPSSSPKSLQNDALLRHRDSEAEGCCVAIWHGCCGAIWHGCSGMIWGVAVGQYVMIVVGRHGRVAV